MAIETRARAPRQPGVVATFIAMISTALGVAVGFAWNTAVQDLNGALFDKPRYAVPAAFVWALAVTLFAVLVIARLHSVVPEELPEIPEESDDGSHAL